MRKTDEEKFLGPRWRFTSHWRCQAGKLDRSTPSIFSRLICGNLDCMWRNRRACTRKKTNPATRIIVSQDIARPKVWVHRNDSKGVRPLYWLLCASVLSDGLCEILFCECFTGNWQHFVFFQMAWSSGNSFNLAINLNWLSLELS